MEKFDRTKIDTSKEIVEEYIHNSRIIIETEFDKFYDEVMREAYDELDTSIGEPVCWGIVIGKMFYLSEESYNRYRRVEKFRIHRKYKKRYKYR